jgi:transcriptional regulator with XRE-family HTH domain
MRQEIRYGKKIVELRRARGWTQEHLAEATQLEVRTIQRAEKDKTKGPETLQAIAGAFDVELADMQTVRLIPEHRFLRAELVTSYRQFLSVETAHRSEMFSKVVLTQLDDKSDIEELWEQVFCDWDVISPEDSDLWQAIVPALKSRSPRSSIEASRFSRLMNTPNRFCARSLALNRKDPGSIGPFAITPWSTATVVTRPQASSTASTWPAGKAASSFLRASANETEKCWFGPMRCFQHLDQSAIRFHGATSVSRRRKADFGWMRTTSRRSWDCP